MTTAPDPPAVPVCCGKQRAGEWLPRKDEPQVHACQLYPCSGPERYWRDQEWAAAGRG